MRQHWNLWLKEALQLFRTRLSLEKHFRGKTPGKRHRESRLHYERTNLCQLVGTWTPLQCQDCVGIPFWDIWWDMSTGRTPVRVYPKYPKELDTKAIPRGQTLAPVSPYLDEMMMTNMRQFQIPRFPNDKRFQKNFVQKLWTQFHVVGYSERWLWGMVCWSLLHRCHCSMMITRWSQRDSFLEKHPSIWGHH